MKKFTRSIFIISIIILGIFSNGEMIAVNAVNVVNLSPITTDHPSSGSIKGIDRTGWWWTETEVLSTESTGNSFSPLVTLDSEENIHVIWYDYTDYGGSGSGYDIFYKRWDKNTTTWKTTEVVSTETTVNAEDPSCFMDSEDNLHVVWHDATDYGGSGAADNDIFYKRWDKNTSSWTTTEVISTDSTSDACDAVVIVDSTKDVHIVWEELTDDDGEVDKDIYYKKRDFGTGIWGTAEDVSTVSDDTSDQPSLAIDSLDNLHLVWCDWANYGPDVDVDIFYRSLDSVTDSWSVTEVLSTVGTASKSFPFIAVDFYDKIHVAWNDAADYLGAGALDMDIFYKYKPKAVVDWSSTELVSPLSDSYSYRPCIAVDSSGYVHIVYEDFSDILEAGMNYDIFYNYKDPLSGLWSYTQVISTDCTGNSRIPAISIENGGLIHVVWHDFTTLDGEVDWDIFYKKLVGPPTPPQLYSIVPSLSSSGSVNVDWSDVGFCDNYSLYRELSPISTLSNLTALVSTTNSSYTDVVTEDGTYYYVVVAENDYGQSDLSNIEYVQVLTRLLPFVSNEGLVIVCILLGAQITFFVLRKIIKRKKK